jgi:drug/metabolite transporter (DMT)-like permease
LPTEIRFAKLVAIGGDNDLTLHRAEGETPPENKPMPTSFMALLIGGVLPACLWGVAAILQKMSAQHGLGPGPFLTAFGAMIVASGLAFSGLQRSEAGLSWIGVRYALAGGFAYAIAAGLITFALVRFDAPISKLAPILGCNVLITVLLGVFLLGEGASLNVWKAVGGTAIVLIGLALVTSA